MTVSSRPYFAGVFSLSSTLGEWHIAAIDSLNRQRRERKVAEASSPLIAALTN